MSSSTNSYGAKSGSYAAWTTWLSAIHAASSAVSARVGSIGGGTRLAAIDSLKSSGTASTAFVMIEPSTGFVFENPADSGNDVPSLPAWNTCMPDMPARADATGHTSTNASILPVSRSASSSA